MLDLSEYDLVIGRPTNGTADWFEPVMARGRGAVFIDTGFLHALLFDGDQYAAEARAHFSRAQENNFYTTDLVLAEVVRHIAKDRSSDFPTGTARLGTCTELVIGGERIWVCAPSRDVVFRAYDELLRARHLRPDLDLTDCLSLLVLDYAKHRRVFGFDDHFRVFGAALEPRG